MSADWYADSFGRFVKANSFSKLEPSTGSSPYSCSPDRLRYWLIAVAAVLNSSGGCGAF